MPRFVVRQPNGLLAEFSTITDSFTVVDVNEEQSLSRYLEGMKRSEALAKVARGVDDEARAAAIRERGNP